MADLNDNTLRYIAIFYSFWALQFLVGYIAINLLLGTNVNSFHFASARLEGENIARKNLASNNELLRDDIAEKCIGCRATSNSIEELLAQPRQMNAYGQVEDRIKFDEIKKAICKNIGDDREREQCRNFYYTQKAVIELWRKSQSRTSFFDFICIKELKYCCPRNSFGPRCNRCPDCGPNEHCHGEGTRAGNGTCICKDGHTGVKCDSCLPGYYIENHSSHDNKTKCRSCHRSCLFCRKEGPLGCEVCRSGFTWLPTYGCSDVDECIQSKNKICGDNTFCVNTEGSYFCYECDRACDGCHGDGPDMCLRCADGYKLDNGNCVALKKTILPPEANYYSVVGLGVALYIGVSEYIMSTHLFNLEQQSNATSANPSFLTY